MVKNTKGGKKCKRTKAIREETTLNYKTEGQEYGIVVKLLGNCRLEVYCFDGTTRMCQIRGKMRKRVFINKDDIVIVSLRDYQDAKGDIVDKYSESQKRALIDNGTIPDTNSRNLQSLKDKDKDEDGDENISKSTKIDDNGYYWSKDVPVSDSDSDVEIDYDNI